ncbi:hypothetical protein D3C86_1681830 [compost metagenome]
MVTLVRGVGHEFDGGTEFLQLLDGDVTHLGQARFITGAGVDVHQALQQFQGFAFVLLGIGEDLFVRLGERHGGAGAEGEGQAEAGGEQGAREIERHESILVSCQGS